ncbi:retrovirus-related pol polyprotein from transposon TNT 1-94 [Tanacetum coccineum]
MCDLGNYVLQVKINGVVEMVALVDTRASVSVLPYSLYKDLGLGDPRPYQTNLTMADNTQAKAMGEVKNVKSQIGYQAYVVDLLIFDILVDAELPLLLGRPFLRICRAIIDMGRAFEMEGEDDWLGIFEVGRDEDGNVKYGSVAPSFIDIEDDMERALAMEAYFNPFKNIEPMKDMGHTRKLMAMEIGMLEKSQDTLPNPLTAEYERRNKRNTITYSLQPVSNANLKWRDLPSVKRHAYCEKLSKLQERSFRVPRVANWCLFNGYGFEDTLREMMKLEYTYEGDGDIFIDYLNNLIKEKCIWFRLCGHEHILTLPEFAVVLGVFTEDEVKHRLFEVYFGRLKVDDKQFDHKDYWTRVGKPTLTNHKKVLMKEPLMRIVHKVFVGSLVHMVGSRERCQKRDLWMMSALKESRGVNLACIIADHLYKHALRTKKNSVICAGHYVTKIACFLGYCMDDEIKKCSEPIDYEYWISKMLADELDVENTCLKKETKMPTQAEEGSSEPRQEHGGLKSSWGD